MLYIYRRIYSKKEKTNEKCVLNNHEFKWNKFVKKIKNILNKHNHTNIYRIWYKWRRL